MQTIDFKKDLRPLYGPSPKEVVEIDVPRMNFLMIDGEGDPNVSKAYADAVEALFAVSYAAKFLAKKGPLQIDYGVMPLEGLWWSDDMTRFLLQDKKNWKWTAMIMQPPLVTKQLIDQAIAQTGKKKDLQALPRLRFEPLSEGRCAQTLHVGPFAAEGPTISRVHQFIAACGCRKTGKHHEIYLSDIRKADPAKWKTIVRQPMTPAQTTLAPN